MLQTINWLIRLRSWTCNIAIKFLLKYQLWTPDMAVILRGGLVVEMELGVHSNREGSRGKLVKKRHGTRLNVLSYLVDCSS